MNDILERLARRTRGALALVAALFLLLALAGSAEAQASRTRSGDPDSKSGSVSRPAGPSGSGGSSATSSPSRSPGSTRSGGTVIRTRPDDRPDGSPVVVEKDRRPPGGSFRPGYLDPYFYNDWYHRYYNPWWGPYFGPGWWRYSGWSYPVPVRVYGSRVREDMGAMDMDLKPGDTQIWIDGEYVGIADRYDGWPQYLWLRAGTYRFAFYSEGHRTIVREYTIRPGLVIDIEDQLERGESTPPEELFPRPTERRDARLRRYEEQDERARERDDWRERVDDGRDERPAADFGSLRLFVEPREAAVYLDGRLVGTGADLARLRRGLAVEAGVHRIQVVHPDYPEGYETEIEVEPGDELDVEIELED